MNAVFILPARDWSGACRVTVIMGNELINRGHNIRILFCNKKNNIYARIKTLIKQLIFLGTPDWVKCFIGDIKSYSDINNCYFGNDEIIIGVGMRSSYQLTKLIKNNNIKLQYIHGSDPWDAQIIGETLTSKIPKVVVSTYLKNYLNSYRGGEVLAVIPNGVNKNEYFSSIDENKRDGVGTIYSSNIAKDPETIIAVINKIKRLRPKIPIRVFSSDRKPNEISNKYYWRLPSIEKSRELYSMSLVWILASRSEGFSLPILEAMACGCAVVSTDCDGPRDIINDSENGFLVKVGNVEQIVDRVLLLLDNEKIRKKICVNSRKTVEKFTWERSVNVFENVLETLTKP